MPMRGRSCWREGRFNDHGLGCSVLEIARCGAVENGRICRPTYGQRMRFTQSGVAVQAAVNVAFEVFDGPALCRFGCC